jgi:hypothetical protein
MDARGAIALREAAQEGLARILVNSAGAMGSDGHPWQEKSHNAKLRMRVFQCTASPGLPPRFRAVCDVPFSPRAVLAQIRAYGARVAWDEGTLAMSTLREIPDDGVVLQYSMTKSVFGVASRDFITSLSEADIPGGGFVRGGSGVEAHPLFPAVPGVIRGLNLPGCGWAMVPIAAPDDSGARATQDAAGAEWTRVTYVTHVDLRGWLPQWVVAAAMTGSFTSFFEGLIAVLDKVTATPGSSSDEVAVG